MYVCAHEYLTAFDSLFHIMLYNHQTDLKDTFFGLKIINTHVNWVKNLLDNKIEYGYGE